MSVKSGKEFISLLRQKLKTCIRLVCVISEGDQDESVTFALTYFLTLLSGRIILTDPEMYTMLNNDRTFVNLLE